MMNTGHANKQLCVKLIHCGNMNIANPEDHIEKSNFFTPLGFFALADGLKKAGVDVEIIHLDLEWDKDIEEILDFERLDAVGMDCHWVNQSLVVLDTARLIKKIKPGIFIFLGGYTASFFAEEMLSKYSALNAIIKGDGDVPIVELCQALHNQHQNRENPGKGLELNGVQNLVWRKSSGETVCNEHSYAAASKDLEQLDFARMDLMRNWAYYRDLCKFWTSFSPINQFPVFFLEVGRGCRYNCSFCGGNSFAQTCINNRKSDAVRSIDSVISTIKKGISFGYSMFFVCFEFQESEEWYIRLFHRIKQEKLKINFGYGSWGLPSKRFIDEISTAFDHVIIEISPETSNLELRKKNKDPRLFYDNRQLEECLEYAGTKINLRLQLYFGFFLPFDTPDTVFETMSYISKLFFKYSSFTEIMYSNLSTDPGSPIHLQPDKYNIDIRVHHFSDFLEKVEEIYVINKEIPYGGMTLFRPTAIPEEDAVQITYKVDLFNQLLWNFGNPVLKILSRASSFNILADYLRQRDLSMNSAHRLTPAEIKDLLLDLCKTHHIQDIDIIDSIDKEFKNISGQNPGSCKTRGSKMEKTGVITEEEKKKISSSIQKAKKSIEIEFNI